MDDRSLIEDLLDAWEDWREQNPQLPLDQFVADHCAEIANDVVVAFRANAEKLSRIDMQLQMLGDVLPAMVSQRAENPSTEFAMSDLAPGCEPIAGYRLVSKIGGGGFGEVWMAEGPGGFHVALKFVPINSRVGEIEERSLDVIRDVRHPHLLSVFGTWRIGTLLVIATELADRTLLDRFHEAQKEGYKGIPHEELLRYMEEAAKGIDYLNEPATPGRQRIQHRDIKPQNLLVSGGSVKVGDFGLARSVHFEVTGHTGSLTLAYAAPECFDGTTSHRSDQYALAVTYCYLRGGRLPFEGTHVQVIDGHRKKPPDLSMLPDSERPAVAKALAKLPKDRWATCTEFHAQLRGAVPGKITASPTHLTGPDEPTQTKWNALFAVSALSLVVVLGLIAFITLRPRPSRMVTLTLKDLKCIKQTDIITLLDHEIRAKDEVYCIISEWNNDRKSDLRVPESTGWPLLHEGPSQRISNHPLWSGTIRSGGYTQLTVRVMEEDAGDNVIDAIGMSGTIHPGLPASGPLVDPIIGEMFGKDDVLGVISLRILNRDGNIVLESEAVQTAVSLENGKLDGLTTGFRLQGEGGDYEIHLKVDDQPR